MAASQDEITENEGKTSKASRSNCSDLNQQAEIHDETTNSSGYTESDDYEFYNSEDEQEIIAQGKYQQEKEKLSSNKTNADSLQQTVEYESSNSKGENSDEENEKSETTNNNSTEATQNSGDSVAFNDPLNNFNEDSIQIEDNGEMQSPSLDQDANSVNKIKKESSRPDDDDYFVCPLCSLKCESFEEFQSHLEYHTTAQGGLLNQKNTSKHEEQEDERIACGKCNQVFLSYAELGYHMKVHLGRTAFMCTYKCAEVKNMKEHMTLHVKELMMKEDEEQESGRGRKHGRTKRNFMCVECGYLSKQSGHIISHMRSHTGDKPFLCQLCDYRCSTAPCLKRHYRTHTKEKPFQCPQCDFTCSHSSGLKLHAWAHANKRKPYKCPHCDYNSAQKSAMRVHIMIHTGEKPFSCSLCPYKCSSGSSLKRHFRTHTGERPFSCNECKYTCSTESSLKIHYMQHTGEKPYSCKICPYRCSRSNSLTVHMRTHTKEKPYHCTMCNYRTTHSSALRSHMLTHSNNRPFACSLCKYRSRTANMLRKHEISHHKNVPVTCPICREGFQTSSKLKTHLNTHLDQLHLCFLCGHQATSESRLEIHKKTHAEEGEDFATNYMVSSTAKPCNLCGLICENTKRLNDHLIEYHKDELTRLLQNNQRNENVNNKTENGKSELISLLTDEEEDTKPFVCGQCNFITETENELEIHERVEHNN